MFNFFTVLASITLAGIGATLQAPPVFSAIGLVLGMLLALLSFVFWKLDQRVAFLVKHAEEAHEQAEAKLLPPEIRLFCEEPGALANACQAKPAHRRLWTFGRSLRLTFGVMAVIGLSSSIISGLRVASIVKLEQFEGGLKTVISDKPESSADALKSAKQTPLPDGPTEEIDNRTSDPAAARNNLPVNGEAGDSDQPENSSIQPK